MKAGKTTPTARLHKQAKSNRRNASRPNTTTQTVDPATTTHDTKTIHRTMAGDPTVARPPSHGSSSIRRRTGWVHGRTNTGCPEIERHTHSTYKYDRTHAHATQPQHCLQCPPPNRSHSSVRERGDGAAENIIHARANRPIHASLTTRRHTHGWFVFFTPPQTCRRSGPTPWA